MILNITSILFLNLQSPMRHIASSSVLVQRLYNQNRTRHASTKKILILKPLLHRYFVLILGLACLTSISSNMVIHNFTVIVMSPSTEERIPSTTPSPSSITTNAVCYIVF